METRSRYAHKLQTRLEPGAVVVHELERPYEGHICYYTYEIDKYVWRFPSFRFEEQGHDPRSTPPLPCYCQVMVPTAFCNVGACQKLVTIHVASGDTGIVEPGNGIAIGTKMDTTPRFTS
jgi:hypothetical protein